MMKAQSNDATLIKMLILLKVNWSTGAIVVVVSWFWVGVWAVVPVELLP